MKALRPRLWQSLKTARLGDIPSRCRPGNQTSRLQRLDFRRAASMLNSSSSSSIRRHAWTSCAVAGATAYAFWHLASPAFAEERASEKDTKYIRLAEVHEHNKKADSYWVYRGNRVYDITDWVPNHPGGEVILRAVGGSIEPYELRHSETLPDHQQILEHFQHSQTPRRLRHPRTVLHWTAGPSRPDRWRSTARPD